MFLVTPYYKQNIIYNKKMLFNACDIDKFVLKLNKIIHEKSS